MIELGYALSSEEHPPGDLVAAAVRAEELGFSFVGISDHFHPWVPAQGHSAFVWSVIGAIAARTSRLRVGTGVTCPTFRIHPAIVAHAAATCEAMMPGRFTLGLGSGENLNEHVLGHRWPPAEVRLEMLAEAVEIIRGMLEGASFDHRGRHYTVEDARLFTLPPSPPPIVLAASGKKAATLAGQIGDGLWAVAPSEDTVEAFDAAGGAGKPKYGQVTGCWAPDEAEARKTAHAVWPNAGIPGQLSSDLRTPAHFEEAAELVTEDMAAEALVVGPDVERWVERVSSFAEAGYTHVYLHQVGPDQQGFFGFAQRVLVPRLEQEGLVAGLQE